MTAYTGYSFTMLHGFTIRALFILTIPYGKCQDDPDAIWSWSNCIFTHCYHRQHDDMQHVMAQAELSVSEISVFKLMELVQYR